LASSKKLNNNSNNKLDVQATINQWFINKYEENQNIFIFTFIIIITTIISLLTMVITNGQSFRFAFFPDELDIFMDHFNSVVYSSDHPYTKYKVIYPPLITLIYEYIGNITLPYYFNIESTQSLARETRESMMPMLIFIVIVLAMIVACYFVFRKMSNNLTEKQYNVVFFLLLLSYPVIWGLERGNCIFLSVISIAIFLLGYTSDNKWIRLISYIALGVAAGVKIFPALFGILVLKKKGIYDFIICVIVVTIMLFGPFVMTDGDIISFLDTVFNYSSETIATVGYVNINDYLSLIGIGQPITLIVNMVTVAIILFIVLIDDNMEPWKETLLLSSLMIITFSVTSSYLFVYLIIPTIVLLNSEKNLPVNHGLIIILCLAIVFAPLPAFSQGQWYLATIKSICIITTLLLVIIDSIKTINYHTIIKRLTR